MSVRVSRWQKRPGGRYVAGTTDGTRVELERTHGSWRLLVGGAVVAELGRRASFDQAEGILLGLERPGRRAS